VLMIRAFAWISSRLLKIEDFGIEQKRDLLLKS
jgi:hypothetical protein